MGSNSVSDTGIVDLPAMLTVAEAARELRIGRTLAYQLATAFLAGDPTGLPAVRFGSCLRVPRWALDERIRHGRITSDLTSANAPTTEVLIAETVTADASVRGHRDRRVNSRSTAQLSLLDRA